MNNNSILTVAAFGTLAGLIATGCGTVRAGMQLKFDWLIVLENLQRGIMVTDTTLEGPAGPRIILDEWKASRKKAR
jgi:hypothetical protein